MKFYIFKEPYYALIKAESEKEAIENYRIEICEHEDGDDVEEYHETTPEKALEEIKNSIKNYPESFFYDWDSMVSARASKYIQECDCNSSLLIDNTLL